MDNLTLTRYGIESAITIPESGFFTLSIENKRFLFEIITEIKAQLEGKDGGFHLLLNDKELSFEKNATAIFDFSTIDLNSRSIGKLLIQKFAQFLGCPEQTGAITELERMIFDLAEEFRASFNLDIEYDSAMSAENIAKLCSLEIADHKCDLLEKLCAYVNLLCELKPLKLFILVFGKAFLESEELDSLSRFCHDKEVRLLLIESDGKSPRHVNECGLVVDKDLCVIAEENL
ncbi:MAG: type II-A CRISPR-associated protein Csn2 [Victivallales bacterium]|jgi:CRISPR type II-A-associated protein Csn2|nr:type II-A CRISPR-associated protein Csn2 [Victivallales bacterium]